MSPIDISGLLQSVDEPNQVLEIFVCPELVNAEMNPVPIGWATVPNFLTKINFTHTTKLYEYHHRDMTYSYDQSNDSQRVFRKTLQKEAFHNNVYGACFDEDVQPSHRFPSTQEIVKEGEVTRSSMRINNRMFLYHDVEDSYHYIYVRYQHAPNVDIKKMQEDLERIMGRLSRSRG